MVNQHSGLMGVSETSGDMQELLAREASDPRAAEAVSLFCYQVKKWIGAYVAVLGGLDALVFSGGIGEHSPEIRRRACEGLECFGIGSNGAANEAGNVLISPAGSRVGVYVIPTNEELMIARSTAAVVAAN
jgi:acetate kinase